MYLYEEEEEATENQEDTENKQATDTSQVVDTSHQVQSSTKEPQEPECKEAIYRKIKEQE